MRPSPSSSGGARTSNSRMQPDSDDDQTRCGVSCETSTVVTQPRASTCRSRDAADRTTMCKRTSPSIAPVARDAESDWGMNRTPKTFLEWPVLQTADCRIHRDPPNSHTRSVRSSLTDAKRAPSWLHCMRFTQPVWFCSSATQPRRWRGKGCIFQPSQGPNLVVAVYCSRGLRRK
jgi:hypothetical protein